jgi:hypothetical protein
MRLNLGCGRNLIPSNEWINVDIDPDQGVPGLREFRGPILIADLSLPWPWLDSTVEEIRATNVFEYIRSRREPAAIHVMNEAWRVLKPGGLLTIECPDASRGAGQVQDPRCVTPWTPSSLQFYVAGSEAHRNHAAAYGIRARFRALDVRERMYHQWAGPGANHVHSVLCTVWQFSAELEALK